MLIGRSTEQAQLLDTADKAVEYGAQCVVLSGEAGIGKSALAAQFLADLADGGWGCHVGHCIEYGHSALPFGPIVPILRSLFLGQIDAVDSSHEIRFGDLAFLLPELRGESAGSPLSGDVDRLLDAITGVVIAAAAKRPVAILIEDMHWADAATRDLVSSWIQSLGTARVLILLTERSDSGGSDDAFRVWLAERRRFSNVSSIPLEGLSIAELAEQSRVLLGTEPSQSFLADLVERTGGNAYFAHELILASREGDGELPLSLQQFLTSRLQRSTPDEQDVIRLIAVAPNTLTHQMLKQILPNHDINTVVRSLVTASIVEIDGSTYRFHHALLREVVLPDLLPFEVEDLHRQVAVAINDDPRSGRSPAELASIAHHWHGAKQLDESLSASVIAAHAAASVAAYDTAADMGLQALAAWPDVAGPEVITKTSRDDLLLEVSEWLSLVYRGREVLELVEGALETWAAELPRDRRALLMARVGVTNFFLARPSEAAAYLTKAHRLVEGTRSAAAAQVHHRISKQALLDGHIRPALEAAESALAIAEETGPATVVVEALAVKALATGVLGEPERGRGLVRSARELAKASNLVSQVANTYRTEVAISVFNDGRTDDGLAVLYEGLEYAEHNCGPRWQADLRLDLLLGLVEAGRLADAGLVLDQMPIAILDDLRRLTVLQTAALYHLGVGRLDEAEDSLDEAEELAERYRSAQETGVQARHRAELARRTGDPKLALDLIDRALSLQLGHDNLSYTRESIVEKVRIVRELSDRSMLPKGSLARVVGEARGLVDGFEGPGQANAALRLLMEFELSTLDGSLDLEQAGATIEAIERCGLRYEATLARLTLIEHLAAESGSRRLGAAARRENDDLRRETIETVNRVSTEHGMVWVADKIKSVAAQAGIELRDDGSVVIDLTETKIEYPNFLTEREVEVLSLLAKGLTNKAIGSALFVSPRTVSTHVSNILAKLHVSTRGEAGARFYELGLAELLLEKSNS